MADDVRDPPSARVAALDVPAPDRSAPRVRVSDAPGFGPSLVRELIATHGGLDRARRLVLSQVGWRLEAAGIDPRDFMQDYVERLLRCQLSPASAYNPKRGMALTTYLVEVGISAAKDHLRRSGRYERWGRETPAPGDMPLDPAADVHEQGAELGPALDRLLDVLDTDEEKAMAQHLAAGCTLIEIEARMGLAHEDALELRTRVRALMLALVED
jgi:DNA-directed RNA polymerase specialized sigma24 family protein